MGAAKLRKRAELPHRGWRQPGHKRRENWRVASPRPRAPPAPQGRSLRSRKRVWGGVSHSCTSRGTHGVACPPLGPCRPCCTPQAHLHGSPGRLGARDQLGARQSRRGKPPAARWLVRRHAPRSAARTRAGACGVATPLYAGCCPRAPGLPRLPGLTDRLRSRTTTVVCRPAAAFGLCVPARARACHAAAATAPARPSAHLLHALRPQRSQRAAHTCASPLGR